MAETIDSLQIEINAKAQTANDAIDALVDKLDILSNSLGKLDGAKITNFAESVNWLASSLRNVAGIDGRTFTALQKNITKLADINPATLSYSATSISDMATSLDKIASSANSLEGVKAFASAISKLGNKNVATATANIPQLATALNQLMVTLSKAPTVNKSVIDMTNALANLAAQGSKVGSASASVVNGLNRTNAAAKRASGSTMSLARAFGKFYANYFLLVRGFKGMFNMMESAMELTETVNYFEVTLNNIGESARENWKEYGYESADAYADSFAQRLRESNEKLTGFTVSETGQISQSVFSGLGISPATATQYSAMFAQVANSIGMTEEASVALSEAFVRLGADWASLRNVDFEVAYEKLASGLAGQSRALRAFGVDITMASLQEIAFANGIEKSVSEMTQSEKAYLRLIAIIEQSEVAFGDLARTLYSPANQMRMLSQGVQNLGTLVGNLFLPVLKRTLPVLNGFVIALQRIVIAISESMGIDTSKITESYNDMTEGFYDASEGIDEATESTEKYNRATRGWDELNVLGKDNARGYGVGNDFVENKELNDAFFDAIEKYRKAWNEAYDNIENRAEDFADELLVGIDLNKIGSGVADFAKSVKELSEALLPFVGGAVTGFASANAKMLDTILYFFGGMLESVDPKDAAAVGEAIGKIASQLLLFKGVTSAYTGIQRAVSGLSSIASTLKANSILLTVGIGGIVATNIAGIIKNYTKEAFSVDYIDGIEELSEEIDRQTQSFKERAEAAEKIASQDSELEIIYGKWKEIADKVGELSDEDEGLLKAYADRIKELLPDAAKYIGENGLAYEGAAEQLDSLIQKQLELYRVQASEKFVKDIMQIEIEMEYSLKDLNKQRDEIFKEIVNEFAPGTDLTKNPLYRILPEVEFQNEVLEDIKEVYKKRLQSVDSTLFNTEKIAKARSEYESVVKNIEEYQEIQQSISEQQVEYENIQDKLTDAVNGLTEAQRDYNDAVDSSSKSSEKQIEYLEDLRTEIDSSVSSMYKVEEETEKATKSVGLFSESALKAKDSFTELLDAIKGFKADSIVLPTVESIESKISLPTSEYKSFSSSLTKNSVVGNLLSRYSEIQPQQNVNVTFEVKGDPNGLFTAVQKQADQYTKSTGKKPFSD